MLTRLTRLGLRTGTSKDTKGPQLSCRLAHGNGLAGIPRWNLLYGRQYVQEPRPKFCVRQLISQQVVFKVS